MSRLGIYVIYDADGIIDEYVANVLAGLRPMLSRLIVVCNFTEVKDGLDYIERYADEIRYRENIGFDAGAYKDVFQELYDSDEIYKFDEILLANDSFYGPIDSFDLVFSSMGKEDCDYWGLTKYPGGTYGGREIAPHIQSYFVCLKKNVVNSRELRAFWLDMDYPESFIEAVFNFEFRLNRVLEGAGFAGKAYTDRKSDQLEVKFGENPYMKYPFELLVNFEVPILKRKAFDFENDGFSDAIAALIYIDRQTKFDARIIKKHVSRVSKQRGDMPRFNLRALQDFYERHSRIYIYGAGGWGKNLAAYFAYKGWNFKHYIVSKHDGCEENVIQYEEAKLDESDGIIIAVGKKKEIKDIYRKVSQGHKAEHIFTPMFDDERDLPKGGSK